MKNSQMQSTSAGGSSWSRIRWSIAVDLSLARKLPHNCSPSGVLKPAVRLGIPIFDNFAGAAIRMARLRELVLPGLGNTCQMKQNLCAIKSFKVGFVQIHASVHSYLRGPPFLADFHNHQLLIHH